MRVVLIAIARETNFQFVPAQLKIFSQDAVRGLSKQSLNAEPYPFFILITIKLKGAFLLGLPIILKAPALNPLFQAEAHSLKSCGAMSFEQTSTFYSQGTTQIVDYDHSSSPTYWRARYGFSLARANKHTTLLAVDHPTCLLIAFH